LNTVRELNETERAALLFRAIVDSSDDAIISKDLNGIITSWNRSAERLFGYTEAEVIGQPVTILIPSDRLDEEPEIIARLKKGERVDHFQTIRKRKDGTLLEISLTISPVRDEAGAIVGASKIARDATEALQGERAHRLLSAIVDSSDDAIISKNLNGIITSWNQSAERLFGYTAEEAIGQPITILIPPDRLGEEPQIISRLKKGERVDHFETIRKRKDGTHLDISLTISPVLDKNGIIVGASKIARDITERKRLETEMRRANHDLQQFAYSASHDLQEPLRSIKIFSELLKERHSAKLDEEGLEFLEYLHDGATRMEMLVRDLLTYTQVTKFDRPAEAVDPNNAMDAVLDGLSSSLSESGGKIVSDSLPPVRIHISHLTQLFQNLLGNAIKYRSPERVLTVDVSAERKNGQWICSVSDNGIGIADEFKETIFGLFRRLHNEDEYPGTGLGLAICQRIVDQYGGQIWVESKPGQGSVFRFTIPD
jgi:PAS domain S-box-containing protein